jgi:RNA recognition motif-containing protein
LARLYVGNLPWSATEDQLRGIFEEFGEVQSVAIITDRETGRSRGFGFVEIDDGAVQNAIKSTDGREVDGRPLNVSEARERAPRR